MGESKSRDSDQEAIVMIQATDDGVLDQSDNVNREKRAVVNTFLN
jgi:hypothetical protein